MPRDGFCDCNELSEVSLRKIESGKERYRINRIRSVSGVFGLRSGELTKIRFISLRRGVWFKVLNRLERGLMNLTLMVTRKVRSRVLASALRSIIEKLLYALESKVEQEMRRIGVPLADKISRIAQKWGNRKAREWAKDVGFIQYLAIMQMNR